MDFEFEVVSLQVSAVDPDDTNLTYDADNLPPGLSIDLDTGLITGTIQGGTAGDYLATITVDDGTDNATETFTWTVIDGSVVATNVALGATVSQSSTSYNGFAHSP